MDKERTVNVPVVTRFVREVIGCNCPDEVFRHIEVQRGSSAVKSCPADYELRIGGRLLIVATSEPVKELPSRLDQVIAEGKRARGQSKFNRFRLVVQSEHIAEEKQKPLRAFDAALSKD